MLYDAQRRFEEAQRHFERALNLIESKRGPSHPDLAMPLNYLGALHAIQHQFDMALPYFERAFSIEERSLGPAHPLMREYIKYLASLHVSRAQYQEAEAFLTRVLNLAKPPLKEIGREAAENLDNYERLHTAQEEYNKAKPYLEEFDRVDDGQLPQNLHEMSASLARLAKVLATHDKFEKAESLLHRVVEETEKAHGSTGIGLAHRLSDLADVYWAWGKLDAAIPLMERSLSMMTGNPGLKDGSDIHPFPSTGPIFLANKHLAEAAASYRQVLGTRKSHAGGGQRMLLETQQTYLALLHRANQAALQNAPT
jgi:tetratricopeptide (TPR) repeat protein